MPDLVNVPVRIVIGNVVTQAVSEQERILQNKTDMITQVGQREILYGMLFIAVRMYATIWTQNGTSWLLS